MDGESFSLNESLSRDTKVLRLQYALINKECILHEKASSFYSTSYFYINITNIVFLSSTTLVNFINQIFGFLIVLAIYASLCFRQIGFKGIFDQNIFGNFSISHLLVWDSNQLSYAWFFKK
jgi:hypothetical protein